MYTILISLMSIVISLYVILPLVRGGISRREDISVDGKDSKRLSELLNKKEVIMNEIADVDFDHGLGKLNHGDYKEIKSRYMQKAAEILKQIEEIKKV